MYAKETQTDMSLYDVKKEEEEEKEEDNEGEQTTIPVAGLKGGHKDDTIEPERQVCGWRGGGGWGAMKESIGEDLCEWRYQMWRLK